MRVGDENISEVVAKCDFILGQPEIWYSISESGHHSGLLDGGKQSIILVT